MTGPDVRARRARPRLGGAIAAAALAISGIVLSPPAPAAAAAVSCSGKYVQTDLSFTSAKVLDEYVTTVYRSGGVATSGRTTTSHGTNTHKVTVGYCRSTGSSTWRLITWHSLPNYGPATVTIRNNKITNASGPLTLVKRVGTTTVSGTTRQYVDVAGYLCVDAKLTAAMKAQQLAKFVTGLPIPLPGWGGVAAWAVSTAIPDVTTPRTCATTGMKRLTFSPTSTGKAVWTSSVRTTGTSTSITTVHGESTRAQDGSWVRYWNEVYRWKIKGK